MSAKLPGVWLGVRVGANDISDEDINFVGSNPRNQPRQLFGYAVSAKRYALFTKSKRSISIVKCSGHGLGYLQSPVKVRRENEDLETPRWIPEAWAWLLQKELRLKAPYKGKSGWLGHDKDWAVWTGRLAASQPAMPPAISLTRSNPPRSNKLAAMDDL